MLLQKARESLNRNLCAGPEQIGPILAEGTKGNPRQVKRFLNALLIRQAIAMARGFEESINQTVLAKLMLAERFQPDFYEYIAGRAMVAENGKVRELAELEISAEGANENKKSERKRKDEKGGSSSAPEPEIAKWLEREWLQRWVQNSA